MSDYHLKLIVLLTLAGFFGGCSGSGSTAGDAGGVDNEPTPTSWDAANWDELEWQ